MSFVEIIQRLGAHLLIVVWPVRLEEEACTLPSLGFLLHPSSSTQTDGRRNGKHVEQPVSISPLSCNRTQSSVDTPWSDRFGKHTRAM